jgi:hypothetical protein
VLLAFKERVFFTGNASLGFDTKVSGKFDDSTRAVITRWQAARGSTWLPNSQLVTRSIKLSAITPKARSSRYSRTALVSTGMGLKCLATAKIKIESESS